MTRLIRPFAVVFALAIVPVSYGQQPADAFGPFVEQTSASDVVPATPQPPAANYQQTYAEIPSARVLIFRNAAQMAAQRRARLASMRWLGLSNLRPVASQMPGFGTYSPMWVGNHWDSNRWVGTGGYSWR